MRGKLLLIAFLLLPLPAFATTAQEVISDKGVKAWLIEEHTLPLLSVRVIFVDAGSASDPQDKQGRASMTSDLLMEGAGARDAQAFAAALDERAIRLDFDQERDLFAVSLETLSEHKAEAMALMADALTRPRFDASAIERIRNQKLTYLKQLSQSPGWIVQNAWEQEAFPGHPYAQNETGTAQHLKQLSRKDFSTFRERYLSRGNMIVAVVGDITPEELKPLLDKTFGELPATFAPEREVKEVALPTQAATRHIDRDMPQTLAIFGVQGLKRNDPAYFDGMVLNYIIGGDLNSRLATEVREKRGLAYSINTSQDPFLHGAVWGGTFSTRNDQANDAMKTAREVIAQAPDTITQEEVDRAKRYLTGSFMLSLDTNRELASFLISMQLNKLGRDYLEVRNKKVEAVTLSSVKEVAKRLLTPERFITATIGRPGGADAK